MKTTNSSHTTFADELHLEQSHAYVIHHLRAGRRSADHRYPAKQGPAITITFQLGSGAREISQQLVSLLRSGEKPDAAPWTVFDRELIQAVLEDHNLPASMADLMVEEYRPYVRDVLEEILDLRPPSWVITPKIDETVLRLARAGNVILMGHCANYITRSMNNVFHVRIISSLETRVERVRQLEGSSWEEAMASVRAEDRRRTLYAKQHYHYRPEDDQLYHLVVNTDRMAFDDAAEVIAGAARRSFAAAANASREFALGL